MIMQDEDKESLMPEVAEVSEDRDKKRREKRNMIINMVLLGIIIILIVVLLLDKYVLTIMKVKGPSMNPTLHDGQSVMVYHTKEVERGDIVVFTHDDKFVVKRVIGIAGDHVEITAEGEVILNGKVLDDDYGLSVNPVYRDVVVGEGEIFALGDNGGNSHDSSKYGAVSIETIFGKLI